MGVGCGRRREGAAKAEHARGAGRCPAKIPLNPAPAVDPNLHQKQGVNHLNKVLGYAPFVAEGRAATVHLTAEDWGVVADTLFAMDTPKEMLPDAIHEYGLANENQSITLRTDDYDISIDKL
jgi:hypothetical protein